MKRASHFQNLASMLGQSIGESEEDQLSPSTVHKVSKKASQLIARLIKENEELSATCTKPSTEAFMRGKV